MRGEIISYISDINEYVFPDHSNIIYPDTHCYKFNGLPQSQYIMIRIYEGSDLLAEKTVYLLSGFLNLATIDLSDPNSHYNIQTETDLEETGYSSIIDSYLRPLPSNLPYGDMDPDFKIQDDYDGDLFSNIEEVLQYGSHAQYPTIPLSLHKGINIFYFPLIHETLNIVPKDNVQVFYYNLNSDRWNEIPWDSGIENTFNAIHTFRAGMFYLDLRGLTGPVLHLRGFLLPGYTSDEPDPYEYLDDNLFDPGHFGSDSSCFKIFNHEDFAQIETISSRNFRSGAWKSGYRFFGSASGADTFFSSCPYDIHVIHKKTYIIQ